jgi:hypothetical protein
MMTAATAPPNSRQQKREVSVAVMNLCVIPIYMTKQVAPAAHCEAE